MSLRPFVFVLLLACSGGSGGGASTPAAAPAKAPAPAPAAVVGPDGPESIVVPPIAAIPTDAATVEAGAKVYAERGCGGCHKFGEKLVGPDLTGVFSRRSTPWVERMITDPAVMVKQDPQAKELFRSLMVEMPKQGVPASDLPALLAYIKSQGG